MQQARAKGLKIPPELLVGEAKGKGANMLANMNRILDLVGAVEAGQREALLDRMVEELQAKEGSTLATIGHVDDGDIPQQILAVGEPVGPAPAQPLPQSRLADLLSGGPLGKVG